MEFVKKRPEIEAKVDCCSSAFDLVHEYHTDPKNGNVSVIICDDDYDVIGIANEKTAMDADWIAGVITLATAQGQPVLLVVVYDCDKDGKSPITPEDIAPIRDLRVALWDHKAIGLMDAIIVRRDGVAYTFAGEHNFRLQ